MSQRQSIKKETTRAKNPREVRRERELTAQKEKRAKQHMLRREPLLEVQEETVEPPSIKSKAAERTERLRAWQKARDERKRQEKLAKKEPFRFMLTRPFYLDPVSSSDKPAIASAANESQIKQTKPATNSDVVRPGPVTRSRSGKLLTSKNTTAAKPSGTKTQPRSTRSTTRVKQPTKKTVKKPTRPLTPKAKSQLPPSPSPQETSSTIEVPQSPPATQVSPPAQASSPPPTTQASSPPAAQDPAWIPGATIGAQSVSIPAKTFDEVFGDSKGSSPFRFSGSNSSSAQPSHFNFQKLPESPLTIIREMSATLNNDDSLNDEDNGQVSSYTRLYDDSIDECFPVSKEEDKSMGKSNIEEKTVEQSSAEKETTDSCAVDFSYFRRLYNDVEEEFKLKCKLWDKKIDDLDNSDALPSEQVVDQIRTTVCQAQLLVRSKLKQYLGLVEKAEDATAARKTTAEDLQGFWDMVYYQVIEIRGKFDELVKLEQNNWQQPEQSSSPVSVQPRRSKRKAATSKPKTTAAAPPSEKLKAAREKREAERKRLRELKMAALKKSKITDQTATEEPSTTPKKAPSTPAKEEQDVEASVYCTPPSSPRPSLPTSSAHRRSSARRRKV